MRSFRLHQFDAFTSKIFGGNPAAVVFDAEHLSDVEMERIAGELNLSATVFVFPSDKGDFRLRYLTREGVEIRFCGHGTVAALYAIEREQAFGVGNQESYRFTIETHVGPVAASMDLSPPEGTCFEYVAPPVHLEEANYVLPEVMAKLGISLDLIDVNHPLLLDKTSSILYFTAASLEKLEEMHVDRDGAADYPEIVAFAALTNETHSEEAHGYVRVFAPNIGIPEDPFSGAVQPGLVAYLREEEMIPADLTRVRTEQGHQMGRAGHVELEILSTDPLQTKLHCEAVHVFSTELNLP